MLEIHKIIKFKSISSTQEKLKEYIQRQRYLNKNIVLVAEKQTAGKGQRDNKWSSEKGGLYFSFSYSVNENQNNLKKFKELSIFTADTVSEILKKKYGIKTKIKPPNDVYAKYEENYFKISGILIETVPVNDKRYIITGIGINFNNKIPDELKNKAINLKTITGKNYKPESFLKEFFKAYFSKLKKIEFT